MRSPKTGRSTRPQNSRDQKFFARVAPRFERTLASGFWSDGNSSQPLRLANSQRPGRIVSSQSRDSDETFHDMAPFLFADDRPIFWGVIECCETSDNAGIGALLELSPHTYDIEFIWQITILCGAH
jgi:hypothetical protein